MAGRVLWALTATASAPQKGASPKKQVAELRQRFPSLTDKPCRGFSLDPTRFVLKVKDFPQIGQFFF